MRGKKRAWVKWKSAYTGQASERKEESTTNTWTKEKKKKKKKQVNTKTDTKQQVVCCCCSYKRSVKSARARIDRFMLETGK